jgi:hypothetical protein
MLSKKRKYQEIETSEEKVNKTQKSVIKKKVEYICFKHDHNKQTCGIYDCSGSTTHHTCEDLRKVYLT